MTATAFSSSSSPLARRLVQLEAELADVRARLLALEQRFEPGDRADVAALAAIGAAVGGQWFTSRQLLAYARTDSDLAAALEAADVENVYELGKLLARLRRLTLDGFAVEREDTTRRWRIVPRS